MESGACRADDWVLYMGLELIDCLDMCVTLPDGVRTSISRTVCSRPPRRYSAQGMVNQRYPVICQIICPA